MTDTPQTPDPTTGSPVGASSARPGDSPISAPPAPTGPQTTYAPPKLTPGVPRTPSLRVSAALAAAMLAIGVVVGAAIGPTPSSSLAGTSELPLLLRTLSALEASRQASAPSPAPPPAPASTTATTPAPAPTSSQANSSPANSATPAPTSSSAPSAAKLVSPAPKSGGQTAALPPITSVWLIELSGEGFAQAQSQASAAPYLTGQAIPSGTLLSGWSTLDAGAFANEAALLAGTPPQTLDMIVQPPCPEGAAGAACAPGTPRALTAADEFVKQVIATLTPTAAYHAHGLIVVTFSSIASATATGLPVGATSATLSSEPPAGVLLISPFAAAGKRSTTAFNPTSPSQSLQKLLHQ